MLVVVTYSIRVPRLRVFLSSEKDQQHHHTQIPENLVQNPRGERNESLRVRNQPLCGWIIFSSPLASGRFSVSSLRRLFSSVCDGAEECFTIVVEVYESNKQRVKEPRQGRALEVSLIALETIRRRRSFSPPQYTRKSDFFVDLMTQRFCLYSSKSC